MRCPNERVCRRGAAMVEAAIILPVFLLLIFGMIDVGMGVFRNNLLSEAARHGARQAIVHGAFAPTGWDGGPWGPRATAAGTATYPAGSKNRRRA